MSSFPDPLAVARILETVADEAILPRFRNLAAHEVLSKSGPADLVTIADREAEALLKPGLMALAPDAVFVGEESAASDPALLGRVGAGHVWLVDPIDGTANFAAGLPNFGVQAAYVVDGVPVMGWLYDPVRRRHAIGVAGEGAELDGKPIDFRDRDREPAAMSGTINLRFLEPTLASAIAGRLSRIGSYLTMRCAVSDYLALLDGVTQFAMWARTYPWDHAPGIAILRAAGGIARRHRGQDWRADEPPEGGAVLCASPSETSWRLATGLLLED